MCFWIFSLISLLSFSQIEALYCPFGSFQVPNENVCAFAIPKSEYYHGAVRGCASRGAVVARVQNAFENAYFYALINSNFNNEAPYIGVEMQPNGNFWTYSDGSQLTYQYWAPGEPRNRSETNICVVVDPATALWKTADCTVPRPYFCTLLGNDGPCPKNWVYFATTKSCYYLQNTVYNAQTQHWFTYDFSQAESECQKSGAHLVSIHSTVENNFVYDLIGTNFDGSGSAVLAFTGWNGADACWANFAWIGLRGTGAKSNGIWSDGTPVDFTTVGTPIVEDYNWRVSYF
ncbi:unnamed protein product, partial [Mesorhabditis belari]|uniref:C-type lectin domain-containing protein n=1 Tax=Mesorhabditis belari TaxID=2138241 RepID=A0AAF3FF93_9BILA